MAEHRRWLLLPVEVKTRAFESRLLLAAHAVHGGWNVIIGRKSALNSALRSLPRGVYLDKCIQATSLEKTRYAKELGNTYAAIDEEGLVHEGGSETYPKRRLSAATLDETSRFCAWGEAQAELVRGAYPDLADRVVVSGNPRVDLWRPELHELHRSEVDRLRESVGDFVLFPSNFANVIGADGRALTEQFGHASGHYADPAERRRFESYLDFRRQILDRLVDALPRLARGLPEGTSLVVRPHPAEDHRFWDELSDGVPNMLVRYEGTITPWLLASRALVHSNCTTGVEAAVAGVPCVAYSPLDDADYPMLPNQVSRIVESDDDLVSAVSELCTDRAAMPERSRVVLEHHLAAVSGPLASRRLLDILGELPARQDRGDGREGRRRGDDLRTLPTRLRKRRGRRRVPAERAMPAISATLANQKFPPASVAEVEGILGRFGEVLPAIAGVAVTEVGQSLFRLTADEPD